MAKIEKTNQTEEIETPELDKSIKKQLDKIEEKHEGLAKQVQLEYEVAYKHQKSKKDEYLVRLRLYNNQMRDKDAVGDTTMFTIFQTVFASLYTDKLSAVFTGREEGDDEVAENLQALAEYDYDEMGKDETDFEWDWDSVFFGRGICGLSEFVRDPEKNIFVPIPEVYDPTTFLRDPRATSINGNHLSGRGGARFFGRELRMTKNQMKENPNFFKINDYNELKYNVGTKSLLNIATDARTEAQGNQKQIDTNESGFGANTEHIITEWNTHREIDGKVRKIKCWLGNERKTLLGVKVLSEGKWAVLDRPLYPTSHDWDGTSIPDLTEDKQRHRAVAQNLGMKVMLADLYPMYIYDINKVKNRSDLNFGFNKFVPSDGDVNSAIQPMRKGQLNMNLLDFILNSIDISAQKATATPELQQGQLSGQQRTLGEINIVASKVETRYSLTVKVFGWSEKRFWEQWYRMYKENFADDIDEKILRIKGAFGTKFRPLTKDQIITKRLDPDITIKSEVISRAKQLEDRQVLGNFFALILQDPSTNRRYAMRELAKLNGMKSDEINRLFPQSIDERIATKENEDLNDDTFVMVNSEDDHNVHLEIHSKANATESTRTHIETHIEALSLKKKNPALFPQDEQLPTAEDLKTGSQPALRPTTPSATSGQTGGLI